MSKHSPGEWLHEENCVYSLNSLGFNRFSACISPGFTDQDKAITKVEIKANGLLMAAAPELLEAAKWVVKRLVPEDEKAAMLMAAIAKAEGK